MIWTIILSLSIISAILYRLGGIGKPFNTKFRDLGCPACALGVLIVKGVSCDIITIFILCAVYILMFLSLTTYWKFGMPDAVWWTWALTGLGYGLALFPYAWHTGAWLGFILRTICLVILITFWSERISEANLEEGGRGLLFTATMVLV